MAKTSVDNEYIRDSIRNVQTNEITISEDKLKVILEKHVNRIKKAAGALSYISVSLTCFIAYFTTDFKAFWKFSPDQVSMAFFLIGVFFLFISVKSLYYVLFERSTVDMIIKDIETPDADKGNNVFSAWLKRYIFNDDNIENEEEASK